MFAKKLARGRKECAGRDTSLSRADLSVFCSQLSVLPPGQGTGRQKERAELRGHGAGCSCDRPETSLTFPPPQLAQMLQGVSIQTCGHHKPLRRPELRILRQLNIITREMRTL